MLRGCGPEKSEEMNKFISLKTLILLIVSLALILGLAWNYTGTKQPVKVN